MLVTNQYVSELIREEKGGQYFGCHQLFLQSSGRTERAITVPDKLAHLFNGDLGISPDGKYIAVRAYIRAAPEVWREYSDPEIRSLVRKPVGEGQHSFLTRYLLVNTETGEARALIDAPLSGDNDSRALWSPDGRSVVITDAFLPLDGTDAEERRSRRNTAFTVEVNIYTGRITKVSSEAVQVLDWDARTGQLICVSGDRDRDHPNVEDKKIFMKSGDEWKQVSQAVDGGRKLAIILTQDLNSPPMIYAIDPGSGRRSLLLELNPQFKNLLISRVQQIHWKASDGHDVTGGLYYPVHYIEGRRYPLVIQNHGFDPGEFAMGPGTSTFAAQPLAGADVFVVQAGWSSVAGLSTDGHDAADEAKLESSAYEGAIDYLDGRGLIDRGRVGVGGFSRTGLHVKYALTQSKYHFAAATITDDTDGGYFQYLFNMNSYVGLAQDYEILNGGCPDSERDSNLG